MRKEMLYDMTIVLCLNDTNG